jgi:hypothetical protein
MANIGSYTTRFNKRIGNYKKAVLLNLFGSVIRDTPVLTGRLRGNWTFTEQAPATEFPTTTDDPTTRIFTEIHAQVKPEDERYYLSNSMPYASDIEYLGHSKVKAPEGMVRRNIVRIQAIIASKRV